MLITDQPISNAGRREQEASVLPVDGEGTYSDWCAMFHRDAVANPFQHPDYVLAELDRDLASTTLQPVILRVGTEGTCEGIGVIVPKSIRTEQVGGVGPGWSMRGLRLAGGSFLTVDQSVETESQLLAAAANHCTSVGADFLLIEDLDEQSSLHQAVQKQATDGFRLFAARDIQARWRINFPDSEEDYWKTFSSRTRRAFRTRLKRFGQTRLERITNIDQIPAFLAAAHEISKQSWQSRQFGLRIRNDQSELEQLSVLARHGFLRSYLWQVEGEPAAFAICHQHADYFRYEEIAYCARFSPLSPGETMLQQIVEDLYRHDLPHRFDFGGGDAEYKRRFGNLESRSQTLWLVPPTWRAGSSLAYLNICRGLRSSVRGLVKTCGLATKARQWLRYGGRAAHAKANTVVPADSDDSADSAEKSGR